MTTATTCRTLPLMPPTNWMAFGDGPALGPHDSSLLEHDSFNFDLDPSFLSAPSSFSQPPTIVTSECTSSAVAFLHPLTAPSSESSSSSSPALAHLSAPTIGCTDSDPSSSTFANSTLLAPSSLDVFPIHSSVTGVNTSLFSTSFSPPLSPIMPLASGFPAEQPATTASSASQSLSILTSPPQPALSAGLVPPASQSFVCDDVSASLSSNNPWFDASLASLDPRFSSAPASATFPSIRDFVSPSGPGPSSNPVGPNFVSFPVSELNAFAPVVSAYSVPIVSGSPATSNHLDFGDVLTPLDPAMSSRSMVNSTSSVTGPAESMSLMMPPPPHLNSNLPFDRLGSNIPMVNNLSHSPDLSPTFDPTTTPPFDNRPSKRQRISKSISISPNLLSDSQQMTRPNTKSTRQSSVEVEDRKGQCPIPECGRVFKDLKAHMLTHQTERPEKCPIPTCEYHLKGFARKYDKNRHTLTHYRGTMICIFCPGSGSAAEQTFNRVDAFKKHLTVAHGVEQAPPNSRKRNSSGRLIVHTESGSNSAVPSASGSAVEGPIARSEALCSTCSLEFHSPQEFYEHLDDCVLRVVQKLDPTEMFNERNLGAVVDDEAVIKTLARHKLPAETEASSFVDDQDDNSSDAGKDIEGSGRTKAGKRTAPTVGALPGGSNRKRRRNYPNSWGCSSDRMNIRKRVMCVYDGPERLCKDNMVLDREYEVRVRLSDGKSYVTDFDVQMLTRAEALLNGQDGENGSTAGPIMPAPMGVPAGVFSPHGDDVNLYFG